MANSKEAAPNAQIDFRKAEDFAEFYANNVQLFSSAWDLRLTFGHLDPSIGPNAVVQETAITVPWPQAKVMLFYLLSHLAGQEAEHGHVSVPKNVIPEIPKQAPPGVEQSVWAAIRRNYDQFVEANPEMKK